MKDERLSPTQEDCSEKDNGVSLFRKLKLEAAARKNWDRFYQRNATLFFKDRHWTREEFPELFPDLCTQDTKVLLECGSGVGNLVFPLLQYFPNLFIYACDFSPRAIEFLKADQKYDPARVSAFVCDLTTDRLLVNIPADHVDICTLVYVLSSIGPDKFNPTLQNIRQVLKPNGTVYVRDYAVDDLAEMRFSCGQKISDHFYVRQDGTRSYFFSEETLSDVFLSNGFQPRLVTYVHKKTVNHKENIDADRLFIQGTFTRVP